jgi:uncharacterized protein
MDENLENFVSLLDQHRRPPPASDELRHLPDWARRALEELPDMSRRDAARGEIGAEATAPQARSIHGKSETGDVALAERPESMRPISAFRLLKPAQRAKKSEETSNIDFSAMLRAAESPSCDQKSAADELHAKAEEAPVAAPPADPETSTARRKFRLLHALLPALALAIVAGGGIHWYVERRAAIATSPQSPTDAAAKKPMRGAIVVAKPAAKAVAIKVAAIVKKPKSAPTVPMPATQVASAVRQPVPVSDPKPAPPAPVAPMAKVAPAPTAVAAAIPTAPRPHQSHNLQLAMLTPPNLAEVMGARPPAPTPPTRGANQPTWLRFAVPAAPRAFSGEPRVAIVIDDLGLDQHRTARAIALNGGVTLSFLAYASNLPQQAAAARHAGHELIVHVPMEPIVGLPGQGQSAQDRAAFAQEEILRRVKWDLSRFKGYVGVDNHLGSELSRNPAVAQTVMNVLKQRGLLFLDAHRGDGGTAFDVAQRIGVPTATRDIFLDNDVAATAIERRLAALEKLARTQGTAIAIARPHDRTLDALTVWLGNLKSKGIQLVPLTAIVQEREQHAVRLN